MLLPGAVLPVNIPVWKNFTKSNKDSGLVICGFPCNQFGEQEPGSNEDIKEFCTLNYGVSFPMFSRLSVNGSDQHPLYKFLLGDKGSNKVELQQNSCRS